MRDLRQSFLQPERPRQVKAWRADRAAGLWGCSRRGQWNFRAGKMILPNRCECPDGVSTSEAPLSARHPPVDTTQQQDCRRCRDRPDHHRQSNPERLAATGHGRKPPGKAVPGKGSLKRSHGMPEYVARGRNSDRATRRLRGCNRRHDKLTPCNQRGFTQRAMSRRQPVSDMEMTRNHSWLMSSTGRLNK